MRSMGAFGTVHAQTVEDEASKSGVEPDLAGASLER